MTSLKKYKKLKIEVVSIEDDIITNSAGGGMGPSQPGPGDGGDDWENTGKSISRMNPLDRPLGIFKRN